MAFVPFDRMRQRIEIDRGDSDVALFFSLLYYGEMLSKAVVAGMAAAVEDDRDRNRYRVLHRLVRADGIGEWVVSLDDVLVGPASVHLAEAARAEQRQLTQRCGDGTWQYAAVASIWKCLQAMQIEADALPTRVAARQWFALFALLRNKTRGHAAPQARQCSDACESLNEGIEIIADNFSLFGRPWAYLRQNMSRKYRVTALAGDSAPFEPLKSETRFRYSQGIYVALDGIRRVELIDSDADASDYLFANGQFRGDDFELLSYITNARRRSSGSAYVDPPDLLPASHTQGTHDLDVIGECFVNLPPSSHGYVRREVLEAKVREELEILDRHPIVTMTGSGGSGKTSLALQVLRDIAAVPTPRFDTILWFSARDIDLLPEGAKPVRPHVLSLRDFAQEYVRLVQPSDTGRKDVKQEELFATALTRSPMGRTLFVFDNFETVASPADVFKWVDTYVRVPNKVLITTRMRDFVGDYPIEVGGMTESEAAVLVDRVARGLGISAWVSDDYAQQIYRESDGHPYVMKVLLGEAARAGRPVKPERIVAAQDEILGALFERTFSVLSPAAQRVFLALCSWRSVVPRVALEAVLLRPENERIDVSGAIEELQRMSMIEEIVSDEDREVFVGVPLAALVFGKRKLTASPLRAAVEADVSLLQVLGAARKEDVRHGVMPRVRRLLRFASTDVSKGHRRFEDMKPILEFIAARMPATWLEIAKLHSEDGSRESLSAARECLRRYLEAPGPGASVLEAWKTLADVCKQLDDPVGEVHALVELSQASDATVEDISSGANRINNAYLELKQRGVALLDSSERRILVQKVADAMERRIEELDATDCSRLAWLYMHLRREDKARVVAVRGAGLDPANDHCIRLLMRFR